MSDAIATPDKTEIVKQARTVSERFLADVERQFIAEMGRGVEFTALEQRLVQHMYLSVDQALKAAEGKRSKGTEYSWKTIDRQKLALDTVHRVSLGLDALMPGHLWPIFYWNSHKNLYDVDLRIGYVGRDFVVRRYALDTPVDIAYELVFASDTFKALPRSSSRDIEGYEFEIASPFDRGDIIGGFGYVTYDDARKNRLVLVTQRDFKRSKAASKSSFWADNSVEMHLKTIYHRVTAKIALDPARVNAAAIAAVTADDNRDDDGVFDAEVTQVANSKTIDAPTPKPTVKREPTPAEIAADNDDDNDDDDEGYDACVDDGATLPIPF